MKKIWFKVAIGAGVLAAATVLLWPKPAPHRSPASTTAKASRERSAAPVRTWLVREQPLDETVTATGTIRAAESVDVQAEISGKLMKLHFSEGSFVRAGELLAKINDAELRASLQRAVYRRELARLKAGRIAALVDKGGVPQQEYDIAASELNVLEAEVALIEAQLARTEIRAPFDGQIGLRFVSEGAQITPTTRIARLQAIDQIKIDFTLPEKYGGRVQVGQTLSFGAAGLTTTCAAEIYAWEPQIDETTRTVLVRARAANPDRVFRPGAFARITWQASREPNALLVPAVAVISGSGEKSVFVARQGIAEQRSVLTGSRTADQIQILSGLQAGEQLIVSGLQSLRAGAAIEVLSAGP